MDLERFRGYSLRDVAVTATSAASVVRITLVTSDGADSVALLLEDVVHIEMDTSRSWDDLIDELTLLQLPQHGPWPKQVQHLLHHHHHNNRSALTWLRMDGPGPIELLGARLTVEQ
ncbi:hypothetical protein [Dactylosporangium darangshiense]|uniref:Uncharacterized protein n=1 Tax=Dactylosporangium darangshiense TaxID=579108 RepID=A0ABP8DV38_9ACTN